MEKSQYEQMALMVPEILLLVATSEGVVTSIERAHSLFDDAPAGSPSNSTDGSGDSFEFDVLVDSKFGGKYNSGIPFDTIGGGWSSFDVGVPMDITGGGEGSFCLGVPMVSTDGGEGSFVPGVLLDTTGDEQYAFGVPMDTSGGVEHTDEHGEATNVTPDHKAGSIDYWANTLASAFAPDGPLTAAHREITRLITLHGAAVDLRNLCFVLHEFPHGAVVPHAHDALLRLSSATSATAAAEDFLRLRSALSPRRNDWPLEAKRLVRDARRDIGEARDAVMLMRDAMVREFFDTWMILKRSPPLQASR